MKLNLFLSVVSVFTVFHLCKAGPLRHHLEKRAAFYIANETACVVDNIVYTNGDPIPTDDPCEACRCRPPGFACVLKECKIKPGCRAVRHAGECCPEYICGCEHNGKFYQDGDEIKDPKNPCYQCYCQGSSIACAFVDCIYRDECDNVYVPGECCPQYINCTRDIPDRNLFLGGNVFPPANLLPVFNDAPILPEIPTDEAVELFENPTNPIFSPQDPNDSAEKVFSTESSDSVSESNMPETTEPESFVTEAKTVNTEIEEKEKESLEPSEEKKQDQPTENVSKETVELIEEKSSLLNSESDINKADITESSEAHNLKETTEQQQSQTTSEPQITVESKSEETVNKVEVTEKPTETESVSTETTEKDSQIKNSASENSKSLKLADDDQLEVTEKDQQDVKTDAKTDKEVITELAAESTSAVPVDNSKENSTVENKKESEDNAVEESQGNTQATPLSINNAKIKSESAETATIVVHVKESAKIPTETDFIGETVTPVTTTKVSEENLLKSHDDIVSTNSEKKSTEIEDNKSTNTNFEIFATTQQVNEIELSSESPSTDQNSEDVRGRSDEADNIALDAEENPVSEDKVTDIKSADDLSVKTTTLSSTEIDKEVRTEEEITEESKIDDPTSTVIRIDTSKPITIEIITDSTNSQNNEKTTTESEKEKTEITEEPKTEGVAESAVPEVREDTTKTEEEGTTPVQSEELLTKEEKSTHPEKLETTTVKEILATKEKVQESTTINTTAKPEVRTYEEVETDKSVEKLNTEKAEEKTTLAVKSETTTESQTQTRESKQIWILEKKTSSDNQ